jgi:hypothetical protein
MCQNLTVENCVFCYFYWSSMLMSFSREHEKKTEQIIYGNRWTPGYGFQLFWSCACFFCVWNWLDCSFYSILAYAMSRRKFNALIFFLPGHLWKCFHLTWSRLCVFNEDIMWKRPKTFLRIAKSINY